MISQAAGMWKTSLLVVICACLVIGCDRRIYTEDGVTDGDTFYLAEYANYDTDPVLQAWVAYSLDLSHCQLMIGGDNPARNHSFACELGARLALVDRHAELRARAEVPDPYLEALTAVSQAGFLDEYIVVYHGRRDWRLPEDLDTGDFKRWRKDHLRGHKPERRIIGSWNFKDAESADRD